MIGEPVLMSTVFIAGLLSFFAPCILPLLPVYISVLSSSAAVSEDHPHLITIGKVTINLRLVYKTIIFESGISTSFILLGFGAGALGAFTNTKWFIIICGFIVVLLGLHQIGLAYKDLKQFSIVENALYHGIRGLTRQGHIAISAVKDKENLLLIVKDNGEGFDLNRIDIDNSEKIIKLGGVGIKNVDQRIKLYYGEDYGITIDSCIGCGTTVVIKCLTQLSGT